ncbi:uncharacterized protein LOC126845772 [Adelges cooleyi]|uniref:uncharacterized protein LOC126845772 n=1 Tax=Adelges cooleyi TaxID=133065 RepID=UPI00217FE53D|nr:uncharacterized protein LOC126845772 [Adelges cooleyi]
MSNSSDPTTSSEGIFVARQPASWLTTKNKKPSPSELISFRCPYTLRKVRRIQFNNRSWTVGDIVSLGEVKSKRIFYAQIIELYENDLCEKLAKIMWLGPKANVGVVNEHDKVHYDKFQPRDFVHVSIDTRLIPIRCLTFVMSVPNQYEYKKLIGTDYLDNTKIISHAERYAESDEDDGPKPKSKVRRLLNK